MKTVTSLLLTLVLALQSVLPTWAEANFWAERSTAAQRLRRSTDSLPGVNSTGPSSSAELLASLPLAAPVNFASQTPLRSPSLTSGLPPKTSDTLSHLSQAVTPFAAIRESYFSPKLHAPLVIHVQDAHGIEEAQKNIAGLIESLGSARSVNLVGVEGAEGSLELKSLRDFGPKPVKEVADYFLQHHEITGAEYAGLTAQKEPTLFGVEDKTLYEAHVAAVKEGLASKAPLLSQWALLNDRATRLKSSLYSPDLKAMDRQLMIYQSAPGSLARHVDWLMNERRRLRLASLSVANVHLLSEAFHREARLNFSQVEAERQRFISDLMRICDKPTLNQLIQVGQEQRMGRWSFGEYQRFLRSFCETRHLSLKRYPLLSDYFDYVQMAEGINRNELLNEMDLLETTVQEALALTPQQKTLVQITRDLTLLKKLLDQSLTMPEWISYEAGQARIAAVPMTLSRLETQAGLAPPALLPQVPGAATLSASAPAPPFPQLVDDKNQILRAASLKPFEDFSRYAVRRNEALVEKLLAQMSEGRQETAVLVTGGFHTEGITQLLKKAGASYVVLTPKFSQVPKENYLDIFAHDPFPLEKMFRGETINIVKALALGEGTHNRSMMVALLTVLSGVAPQAFVGKNLVLAKSGETVRGTTRKLGEIEFPSMNIEVYTPVSGWMEKVRSSWAGLTHFLPPSSVVKSIVSAGLAVLVSRSAFSYLAPYAPLIFLIASFLTTFALDSSLLAQITQLSAWPLISINVLANYATYHFGLDFFTMAVLALVMSSLTKKAWTLSWQGWVGSVGGVLGDWLESLYSPLYQRLSGLTPTQVRTFERAFLFLAGNVLVLSVSSYSLLGVFLVFMTYHVVQFKSGLPSARVKGQSQAYLLSFILAPLVLTVLFSLPAILSLGLNLDRGAEGLIGVTMVLLTLGVGSKFHETYSRNGGWAHRWGWMPLTGHGYFPAQGSLPGLHQVSEFPEDDEIRVAIGQGRQETIIFDDVINDTARDLWVRKVKDMVVRGQEENFDRFISVSLEKWPKFISLSSPSNELGPVQVGAIYGEDFFGLNETLFYQDSRDVALVYYLALGLAKSGALGGVFEGVNKMDPQPMAMEVVNTLFGEEKRIVEEFVEDLQMKGNYAAAAFFGGVNLRDTVFPWVAKNGTSFREGVKELSRSYILERARMNSIELKKHLAADSEGQSRLVSLIIFYTRHFSVDEMMSSAIENLSKNLLSAKTDVYKQVLSEDEPGVLLSALFQETSLLLNSLDRDFLADDIDASYNERALQAHQALKSLFSALSTPRHFPKKNWSQVVDFIKRLLEDSNLGYDAQCVLYGEMIRYIPKATSEAELFAKIMLERYWVNESARGLASEVVAALDLNADPRDVLALVRRVSGPTFPPGLALFIVVRQAEKNVDLMGLVAEDESLPVHLRIWAEQSFLRGRGYVGLEEGSRRFDRLLSLWNNEVADQVYQMTYVDAQLQDIYLQILATQKVFTILKTFTTTFDQKMRLLGVLENYTFIPSHSNGKSSGLIGGHWTPASGWQDLLDSVISHELGHQNEPGQPSQFRTADDYLSFAEFYADLYILFLSKNRGDIPNPTWYKNSPFVSNYEGLDEVASPRHERARRQLRIILNLMEEKRVAFNPQRAIEVVDDYVRESEGPIAFDDVILHFVRSLFPVMNSDISTDAFSRLLPDDSFQGKKKYPLLTSQFLRSIIQASILYRFYEKSLNKLPQTRLDKLLAWLGHPLHAPGWEWVFQVPALVVLLMNGEAGWVGLALVLQSLVFGFAHRGEDVTRGKQLWLSLVGFVFGGATLVPLALGVHLGVSGDIFLVLAGLALNIVFHRGYNKLILWAKEELPSDSRVPAWLKLIASLSLASIVSKDQPGSTPFPKDEEGWDAEFTEIIRRRDSDTGWRAIHIITQDDALADTAALKLWVISQIHRVNPSRYFSARQRGRIVFLWQEIMSRPAFKDRNGKKGHLQDDFQSAFSTTSSLYWNTSLDFAKLISDPLPLDVGLLTNASDGSVGYDLTDLEMFLGPVSSPSASVLKEFEGQVWQCRVNLPGSTEGALTRDTVVQELNTLKGRLQAGQNTTSSDVNRMKEGIDLALGTIKKLEEKGIPAPAQFLKSISQAVSQEMVESAVQEVVNQYVQALLKSGKDLIVKVPKPAGGPGAQEADQKRDKEITRLVQAFQKARELEELKSATLSLLSEEMSEKPLRKLASPNEVELSGVYFFHVGNKTRWKGIVDKRSVVLLANIREIIGEDSTHAKAMSGPVGSFTVIGGSEEEFEDDGFHTIKFIDNYFGLMQALEDHLKTIHLFELSA